MKKLLTIVLCCALCAAILCCGKKKGEEPKQDGAPAPGTIIDVLSADGRYSTLAASIGAAGLAGMLAGNGPFTLFAPIDSAFAKMPPGAAESLLQEAQVLKSILLLHVVPGRFTAADVANMRAVVTALGAPVPVMSMPGGKIMFGEAAVVIADIPAKNGVIHVIDKVLLPPEKAPE